MLNKIKNAMPMRRAKAKKSSNSAGVPQPPPLNSGLMVHTVRRFSATSNVVDVPIYNTDLIRCAGMMAVSATDLWSPFDIAKVHSIKIWGPPANVGSAQSKISFTPAGSNSGPTVAADTRVMVDASVSSSEGAFVQFKPKKDTWQVDNFAPSVSQAFGYITCPIGSIVDVDITAWCTSTPPLVSKLVTAGGTAGYWYFPSLDWLNLGAGGSTLRSMLGSGINGVI